MKTRDIFAQFPGVVIIHQKISGYEVDEHQHDEHEFFFPIQGEIHVQAGSQALKAGPGKMIYLPPHTAHSFRSDSASAGERLILIVEDSAWVKNNGGKASACTTSASQLCKEILFQLLIRPQTRAAKSLIETLITTLSEMMEDVGAGFGGDTSPIFHLSGQSKDKRIKVALELIEENYAASLSTKEIAQKAGMSLRNFNRLFLVELGMTPKQVATLHRIEQAKKLLGKGQQSVTDIAFEVGYNSVSQFIATFRKATGQLPSAFLPLS